MPCEKKLLCNVYLLTPTYMRLLGVLTEKNPRGGKLHPWPCEVWVPQHQSIYLESPCPCLGQQIPNFTCVGHAREQGCALGAAQEAVGNVSATQVHTVHVANSILALQVLCSVLQACSK